MPDTIGGASGSGGIKLSGKNKDNKRGGTNV